MERQPGDHPAISFLIFLPLRVAGARLNRKTRAALGRECLRSCCRCPVPSRQHLRQHMRQHRAHFGHAEASGRCQWRAERPGFQNSSTGIRSGHVHVHCRKEADSCGSCESCQPQFHGALVRRHMEAREPALRMHCARTASAIRLTLEFCRHSLKDRCLRGKSTSINPWSVARHDERVWHAVQEPCNLCNLDEHAWGFRPARKLRARARVKHLANRRRPHECCECCGKQAACSN